MTMQYRTIADGKLEVSAICLGCWSMAGGAGWREFLSGHPDSDSAGHPDRVIENAGAQHWDWEACTLRNFKHYLQIPGATSSYIYALDSDGDGLPDRHPSLPMDEERFGTDPNNKDTDGDGLSDLEEFTADIYFGSDPLDTDSDGDGIPDSSDLWPTVAINKGMDYAWPTPVIDGEIDDVYSPLITRWYATNWDELDKEAVQTYACWDEKNLYLAARAPAKFNMSVQTDTSAHNGFWEGGDTYLWNIAADKQPALGIPRIPVWPGSEVKWSTDDSGATVVEMKLPTLVGQGWSREANFGGRKLPEDVVDGLVLLSGRAVSFNLIFDFPEEKKRVLLTPNWTMISTRLEKDRRDPDLPILRFFDKMQNTATPTVRVDGVASRTRVTIYSEDGRKLGSGTGNGPIELSGVKVGSDSESGKNVIIAKTSTRKESDPVELIVDTSAKPPLVDAKTSEDDKAEFSMTGEAGARVTIEYETAKDNWAPVAVAVLNEKGKDTAEVDRSFSGFYGEYFDTEEWTEPVMYRVDPEIKFDYEGGSPAKGTIAPESFSVKWSGKLNLESETKATFFLSTDDGSRLYIDGEMIIDHWGHHGKTEKSAEITLEAGAHDIRIDYYENYGWAAAHLEWQPEGGERTYEMPVTAFEKRSGGTKYRATQVDVLGNKSEPSKTVSIK